mmetsp:Transcript_127835/g.409420  ORF Transcript_127835/g.409420 Transcript_127835/m.409420 type:complete len:250 (-) Transcript_127835:80-829(-)
MAGCTDRPALCLDRRRLHKARLLDLFQHSWRQAGRREVQYGRRGGSAMEGVDHLHLVLPPVLLCSLWVWRGFYRDLRRIQLRLVGMPIVVLVDAPPAKVLRLNAFLPLSLPLVVPIQVEAPVAIAFILLIPTLAARATSTSSIEVSRTARREALGTTLEATLPSEASSAPSTPSAAASAPSAASAASEASAATTARAPSASTSATTASSAAPASEALASTSSTTAERRSRCHNTEGRSCHRGFTPAWGS